MRYLLLLFISFLFACQVNKLDNDTEIVVDNSVFTIAVGSCNDQDKPQTIWKDIGKFNPKIWVWLGDNIYGDTENMDVLKAKYDKQLSNVEYQNFIAKKKVIGTWDDHDYGVNDGGKEFAFKKQSRDLALSFLGVNQENEVWSRPGLYQSYTYQYNDKTIRIILLDSRYFRDKPIKSGDQYVQDDHIDILGDDQWDWLEKELMKEEDVLIIANGIQVIPEEHRFEKWANFPASRERLLGLVDQDSTSNIILLSGDRHIGEISKIQLENKDVFELTSSGLTHSYEKANESNRYRIGELTGELNFGIIKISEELDISLELYGKGAKRHNVVKL